MPESSLIQTSHPSPLCGEDAASCYRHSSVANTRSTAVVSRSFHPHHPLSRSVHPLSRSVHGCVLREAEEGLGCTCWPGGRVERAREEGFDGERERGWIESKIGVWWRGEVKLAGTTYTLHAVRSPNSSPTRVLMHFLLLSLCPPHLRGEAWHFQKMLLAFLALALGFACQGRKGEEKQPPKQQQGMRGRGAECRGGGAIRRACMLHHLHMCMHKHLHVCVRARVRVYTYTQAQYVCTCIIVSMYVCMCVCICAYRNVYEYRERERERERERKASSKSRMLPCHGVSRPRGTGSVCPAAQGQ